MGWSRFGPTVDESARALGFSERSNDTLDILGPGVALAKLHELQEIVRGNVKGFCEHTNRGGESMCSCWSECAGT